MTSSLSIVIPTHRRVPQLLRLLKSIESQVGIQDLQLLVVSNFADDQLQKSLRDFRTTIAPQLLVANRAGVNASRNLGWNHAKGSVLLFLDDDCELHTTDFLQRVQQAHQEFPELQVIGGSYASEPESSFEDRAYNLLSNVWCESHQYVLEQNWALLGGNMSFKASVRELGLQFNEDILYGGSETELHVRMFERGICMQYFPHLTVLHRPRVTTQKIFEKALKQAHTAEQFLLPENLRAANLGKYLYTKKISEQALTASEFKKYLEVFRLHEEAFLQRSQYRSPLTRSKRLWSYRWKTLLC